MTWFKVDDSFYDHPKVFDAPDCAVALWTRAGCWSARNLTGGFVPSSLPARLCGDPDTAVKDLLHRGLWLRASGGYQFHDWTDFQPSKEAVESLRRKRAEAGKKGGQAKAAKQNSSNCQASARPVGKQNATPTRPSALTEQRGSGSAPAMRAARASDPHDTGPEPTFFDDPVQLAEYQAEIAAIAERQTQDLAAKKARAVNGARQVRTILAKRRPAIEREDI